MKHHSHILEPLAFLAATVTESWELRWPYHHELIKLNPRRQDQLGDKSSKGLSTGWFPPTLLQRPSSKPEEAAQHSQAVNFQTLAFQLEPGTKAPSLGLAWVCTPPVLMSVGSAPPELSRSESQAAFPWSRSRSSWWKGPPNQRLGHFHIWGAIISRFSTKGSQARLPWAGKSVKHRASGSSTVKWE